MGRDATGKIWYGLSLSEEEGPPSFITEAGFEDWEDIVAMKSGLPINASWSDKYKLVGKFPVQLVPTYTSDYTIYQLGVLGTVHTGEGHPIDFDKLTASVDSAKVTAFLEFCKEFDIDASGIGWHLAGYYG